MNIGLTYNLKKDCSSSDEEPPSKFIDSEAEWDDQETIDAVREALAVHHNVTLIEANDTAYEKLLQHRAKLDIVFNMAEGMNGVSREAQIPAMLEFLGYRYTASDPLTLTLCLDKARTKEILSYYQIPTARFSSVIGWNGVPHSAPRNGLNGTNGLNRLKYPLIVKPLHEGSSKGIFNDSVVRSRAALRDTIMRVVEQYQEPAVIEEFLPGREFTVAILGNGDDARTLPMVEICFDHLPEGANPVYSYEAKWVWDRPSAPLKIFECPADINEELRAEIERICLRAYKVLGCRDWCRIDVRLDEQDRPHILELNPLPGILPNPEDNSCFPKAARAAGMSYVQLINCALETALRRYGLI
ncbi:MAG: ATP-grasp domain-containing protein [Acidobacteria bacterium]|nr:ATP-grasp domain-containing protein [Acidobacteriota bacterium]MBI3656606.1 ATP-grasp domain-containing protein [Acidobacteriota bacterium]